MEKTRHEVKSLYSRTAPAGLPHPAHQQPDQHGGGGHHGPAQAPEPQAGAQPAEVRLQVGLDPEPRDPRPPGPLHLALQPRRQEDRGVEEVPV